MLKKARRSGLPEHFQIHSIEQSHSGLAQLVSRFEVELAGGCRCAGVGPTAAYYPLCRGRLDHGRRPAVQLVKAAVKGCPRGRGLVQPHLPPLEFFRWRRVVITWASFLVGRRVQVFNVGVFGCGDIFRGNFVKGLGRLDKIQALFLST